MIAETRTSWDERREYEERLAQGGSLSVSEAADLIADADAGGRACAVVEGLERALKQLGITVIDTTTDDDGDQVSLEFVQDPGETRN